MLKPQDITVLLKVLLLNQDWTYQKLAKALRMSSSEVHAALKRCEASKLYRREPKRVLRGSLAEFLIHGIKYAFPATPGTRVIGIPTAHSAEPLKSSLVVREDDIYVWKSDLGTIKGQEIKPLYHCIPEAVSEDHKFYQLLTIVDGLRVGRARERELAATALNKSLYE